MKEVREKAGAGRVLQKEETACVGEFGDSSGGRVTGDEVRTVPGPDDVGLHQGSPRPPPGSVIHGRTHRLGRYSYSWL